MPCPICKRDDPDLKRFRDDHGLIHYRCPRCGHFAIEKIYELAIRNDQPNHPLSGAIREIDERDEVPPILDDQRIRDLIAQAPTSVDEKAERLLRAISRRSKGLGDRVVLREDDAPLAYMKTLGELALLAEDLASQGLLTDLWVSSSTVIAALSMRGRSRIEADRKAG